MTPASCGLAGAGPRSLTRGLPMFSGEGQEGVAGEAIKVVLSRVMRDRSPTIDVRRRARGCDLDGVSQLASISVGSSHRSVMIASGRTPEGGSCRSRLSQIPAQPTRWAAMTSLVIESPTMM